MKKKLVGILFCMLMIVSAIIPVPGTALTEKTSHPLTTGNTLYVGGSGPNNYTKIQDAVNASSNGDIVFVYDDSSPYYENVVVDKSIALIGEDKQTTVICYAGGNNAPIFLQADGVTVQRFTMSRSFYGIRIESNDCIIENNIITANVVGMYIFKGNNTLVEGNVISNNSDGVHIVFTKDNVISRNIISFNTCHGVNLGTGRTLVTLNNISSNGQDGVLIGGDNNTILKNNIADNGLYGINIWNSRKNSVLQNNIYNNRWGNARVQVDSWFVLLLRPFDHTWDKNYWGRPYQFPKAIMGSKYLIVPTFIIQMFIQKHFTEIIPIGIYIPMIKFDWHPAQEPYDIS
jgi:parallel beta-helix repeat protein